MEQDSGRVDHGAKQVPGVLDNLPGPPGQTRCIDGRGLAVLQTQPGLADRCANRANDDFAATELTEHGELVLRRARR